MVLAVVVWQAAAFAQQASPPPPPPPPTNTIVENVPTELGARTMALDEKTHALFLPTAKFGSPPAPTPDRPRPRPTILPDSFEVIEVAP